MLKPVKKNGGPGRPGLWVGILLLAGAALALGYFWHGASGQTPRLNSLKLAVNGELRTLFPGETADLPTQLWLARRYLESIALVAAPLLMTRRVPARLALATFGIITALLLAALWYPGSRSGARQRRWRRRTYAVEIGRDRAIPMRVPFPSRHLPRGRRSPDRKEHLRPSGRLERARSLAHFPSIVSTSSALPGRSTELAPEVTNSALRPTTTG